MIIGRELPGLKIIQTEKYLDLVKNNPGLVHENCGDFYSRVRVGELPEAVYQILDRDKLNRDLIIVDDSTFNSEFAKMGIDYLIRGFDGIGIYSPELHASDVTDANQVYGLFGAIVAEGLFSDEKLGSLQVGLCFARD